MTEPTAAKLIATLERVERRLIAVEAMLQAVHTAQDVARATAAPVAPADPPRPRRRTTKER